MSAGACPGASGFGQISLQHVAEGLTRKIAIVACARGVSTASIFAVNVILTRAWTQEEFGRFGSVWVLANTLIPVFLAGLPTGLLYFFPRRGPGGQAVLVSQTALCLLVSGLVLAGLLGLAATAELSWEGVDFAAMGRYVIPFLPYAAAIVAAGYVESALVAAGRTTWQAGLAFGTAAGMVATALAAALNGWGLTEFLWGVSGLALLRCAVASLLVARAVGFGWPPGDRFGELLRYSFQIGLNDAVGSLSRNVDRLVVFLFFSASAFGIYHIGAIEVPVGLLLSAVITVLVPEVSARYRDGDLAGIAVLWRRTVGGLALFILPLFCFLFAFAGELIALYVPEEYRESEAVFRIFLLMLPLRCAVYNPLLIATGKAHWAIWGSVGDLLLNFILSVTFVQVLLGKAPGQALLGPALATVLATWVQTSLLVYLISRHLRRGLADLLPWSRLARVAAISSTVALVSAAAAQLAGEPLVRLVLGSGVFAAGSVLALLRHPEERQEIRALVRSLGRTQKRPPSETPLSGQ